MTSKELVEAMLIASYGDIEDNIYEVMAKEVGVPFIIKTKHENNIDLTDEEVDYLVAIMEKENSLNEEK